MIIAGKIVEELDDAYELKRILTMTDYPTEGNNSVGQSSVLIKRRSRVQVPVALPVSDELTDEQLENVIGGAQNSTFIVWRINMVNEWKVI